MFLALIPSDSASTNSGWIQQQKLTADDSDHPRDQFGNSVSISGNTLLIGAYNDHDNGYESGSAYVFECGEDGFWSQQQKLLSNDGIVDDEFGVSVSVSGDWE